MNILIVGDSFAADWSTKNSDVLGWPTLLTCEDTSLEITNLAQAGISEYKILQQVRSVPDLSDYDAVIISHTSANRVHTKKHPVHTTGLHINADLIFTDIEWHAKRPFNFFNRALRSAYNFFLYHYDQEYQEDMYDYMYNEIMETLVESGVKVIVVDGFNAAKDGRHVDVDLAKIRSVHPGNVNHLSGTGNLIACELILQKLHGKT